MPFVIFKISPRLYQFVQSLMVVSKHRLSSTVVILLKATKGKSQNRISLKQQRILKNDKSESFLDFYLIYKYLKIMRLFEKYAMKIVEVTIGHF